MTSTLFLQKPFSRQTVYQSLAKGVDHLRIKGGKPIMIKIQLEGHPTPDEIIFEHPYAYEAFIRGIILNPVCDTVEIEFLEN